MLIMRSIRPKLAAMPLRRRIIFSLLWVYKRTLSPLFQMMGPTCRHAPTCSEYAAESIARHGWWPGSWMGLARVCRCRPGGSRGYDPAPEDKPDVPFYTPWKYGDWATHEREIPDIDT